jgi:hypothetical protein
VNGIKLAVILLLLANPLLLSCGNTKSAPPSNQTEGNQPGYEIKPDETALMALSKFHFPMVRVWHFDIQQSNAADIKNKIPQMLALCKEAVQGGMPAKIAGRRPMLQKAIGNLELTIKELEAAADQDDMQKASDAMDKMHAAYERAMRIFFGRPYSVEQFHDTLYKQYSSTVKPADAKETVKAYLDLKNLFDGVKKDEDARILMIDHIDWVGAISDLEKTVVALSNADPATHHAKIVEAYQAFEKLDALFDQYDAEMCVESLQ